MSGAAEPGRAARAMAAVDQQLVRRPEGLILLFTPPFDNTPHDPGYIRGYVPGIRENGGQYTHAAAWTVIAFAALGDGDKACELFRMLNPIARTSSRASVQRYKVEPYVVAGDVYAEPPHVGRGGWTWYTGAAGWLYRAGLEWILGFRMRRHDLFDRSLHPPKLAQLLHRVSLSLGHLSDQGGQSVRRFSRRCFRQLGRQDASRSRKYSPC